MSGGSDRGTDIVQSQSGPGHARRGDGPGRDQYTLATRVRSARLSSLEGVTVGLLDIAKPRGARFLARIEERLCQRGAEVKRYRKPTFSKPAPVSVRQKIASECGAAIEALAD